MFWLNYCKNKSIQENSDGIDQWFSNFRTGLSNRNVIQPKYVISNFLTETVKKKQ